MTEKRWLTEKEAVAYTGLGRNTVRNIAEKVSGARYIGKRVLYDRNALDNYIDNAPRTSAHEVAANRTKREAV